MNFERLTYQGKGSVWFKHPDEAHHYWHRYCFRIWPRSSDRVWSFTGSITGPHSFVVRGTLKHAVAYAENAMVRKVKTTEYTALLRGIVADRNAGIEPVVDMTREMFPELTSIIEEILEGPR